MKLVDLINQIQLYALILFLFSSLICSAGLPPLMQGENLERLISGSSEIVMVCAYKKRWVPPVRGVSKGQLEYSSRIVSVLKGDRKIGDKLYFVYNIEEAPSWLTDFESIVDGELKYLFFKREILIKKDAGAYSFDQPNQSGFDYYDGSLTFLKEKIGNPDTGPERAVPDHGKSKSDPSSGFQLPRPEKRIPKDPFDLDKISEWYTPTNGIGRANPFWKTKHGQLLGYEFPCSAENCSGFGTNSWPLASLPIRSAIFSALLDVESSPTSH